jgi:integrase
MTVPQAFRNRVYTDMERKLEEGLAARIKVPAGERDVFVFDTEQPGFFLRKFASGRAMYGVKYSVAGKPRKIHLYDATIKGVLAKARKEAGDVRAKARLGTDVVADREAAKAAAVAEAARQEKTLGKVAKSYLEAREGELRPRSYVEVRRHIEKHFKPLHGRPIEDITRPEIVSVIDDIERSSGKTAADGARRSLGTLFAWAIDRGIVHATPMLHIKSRTEGGGRERTLTPAELREVWLATEAVDDDGKRLVTDDYARIVKLLILTGQRRIEIGGLSWLEVFEKDNTETARIDLPGERTKNGLPHIVPLSSQALILLPARRDGNDMVFGRFDKGFSGWSKAKTELDAAILAERRRSDPKAKPMPHWVLHDARRSLVTLMGERGIAPPHIIEAIVNHVSGTKAGVAGTYNRAIYLEERRKALEAWGQYVECLIR